MMIRSIEDAEAIFAANAGRNDPAAIREIAALANEAKRQARGWGRLGLLSLRAIGLFLLLHGRRQGRPSKTSAGEVFKLADLGIDYHLSADAKQVGRIEQEVFDGYIRTEAEPTLNGLLRHTGSKLTEDISEAEPIMEGRESLPATASLPQSKWALQFSTNAQENNVEYFTPPEVFEMLGATFDLDVASPGMKKVPWIPATRHLTAREDGLTQDWSGNFIWMNPPYGIKHGVMDWIEKFLSHGNGISLVADWTSTGWWQRLASKSEYVLFPNKKINFLPRRRTASNLMGATFTSVGELGGRALRNAEANGFGTLLRRP